MLVDDGVRLDLHGEVASGRRESYGSTREVATGLSTLGTPPLAAR